MIETQIPQNPMLRVMSLRDFRLLFAGTTTSLLGDQFALIATPWLTLKLMGDPFALGIVLAFAIDAVSFGVLAAYLWLIHGVGRMIQSAGSAPEKERIWISILNGV